MKVLAVFRGVCYDALDRNLPGKGERIVKNIDFTVTGFAVFDSKKFKNRKNAKTERIVTVYEFEFYNEDYPGGHYLDGAYYPVKKGSCFFAKPGQRMRTVFPYKCVVADFSTQDPALQKMLNNLPAFFPFQEMPQVLEILHGMIANDGDESLTAQLKRQSDACRILALLSQHYNPDLSSQPTTFRHQEMLLMLETYIREHLAEDLSLKTLAKLCNLDPTYLHKLYTSAFGTTPARRVLNYRMNAAKRGLLAQEVSLEELAEQCGFSSQSYFCYCFKKYTGKTPMQYRNEQLGMGRIAYGGENLSRDLEKSLVTSGKE